MKTKVCSKCGIEKGIDMFHKQKDTKDGLRSHCKKCVNKKNKEYKQENVEKVKKSGIEYREKNADKEKARHIKYNKEHKEERLEYAKKYNIENADKLSEHRKIYKLDNKEKISVANNSYTKSHKNQRSLYSIIYRGQNPDKLKQMGIKYREENVEKIKDSGKKYRGEHLEQHCISSQKRRAKKRLLPHTFTAEEWNQVKLYFNNRCCYCGEELPLEQEHWLALENNGGYTKENMIPACRSCNSSKNDSYFDIWYPKHESYSKEREKFILEYLESVKEIEISLTSAI